MKRSQNIFKLNHKDDYLWQQCMWQKYSRRRCFRRFIRYTALVLRTVANMKLRIGCVCSVLTNNYVSLEHIILRTLT